VDPTAYTRPGLVTPQDWALEVAIEELEAAEEQQGV